MTAPTLILPKKLIEVALPLDAINVEAAREKSIRHGHPSTLHLWWARRPLAAARAVIFAQLVNDPESLWEAQNPGQKPSSQQLTGFRKRRKNLFELISEFVKWENTTNDAVLDRARAEIRKSWLEVCELNKDHPDAATLFDKAKLPGLHDPFAGGGAIPLEAQRLGLEAYASDLNPVAVLINKAMIEIPPKFAGRPPVHPDAALAPQNYDRKWKSAQGLAEDVRRYGAWMRDEAEKRIGHLYPKVKVTAEMAAERQDLKGLVGQELTVIAWLWARTVKSPNPAFSHVAVPLVSSFVLSSKEGKETWVEPVVEGDTYRFCVRVGKPPEGAGEGTTAGKRAAFLCLMSGAPVDYPHIRSEGRAGRMGQKLLAVVAEGAKGRIYLDPTSEHEATANSAQPSWRPEMALPDNPRDFKTPNYGLTTYGDLFTPRQLVALTTFSDLVSEARERARVDAERGWGGRPHPLTPSPTRGEGALGPADSAPLPLVGEGQPRMRRGEGLEAGGDGPTAYGEAVGVYLAFAASKVANIGSSIASWMSDRGAFRETFARQAIPMVWDFAEANAFADAGGSLGTAIDKGAMVLDYFAARPHGHVSQLDASTQSISAGQFVSTDPPYYDNIGYADLSDFFYVWLRRSLRPMLPMLFAGIAVPKAEELVATPYRHGSKQKAEAFFLRGMTAAMHRIVESAHPAAPVTIYYAFKQSETTSGAGTSSTGWETFLDAVLRAGFSLSGTWPMRTEGAGRIIATGTNALASSIILVCRRRPDTAITIARRDFLRELNAVLPLALDSMTRGTDSEHSPVAPVDLSQAIIGPGMAVFSKYAAVLEADGTPMSVKTALQLINRFLAEDDFDSDTQFCLHWFDQNGWAEGAYGEADVLARAKATSVGGLTEAGVLVSGAGKVRLLRPLDYPADWDPRKDTRLPVWEALHQLVRAFKQSGESGAAAILSAVSGKTDAIRQLAYRLYTLCERRGWAEDARAYNELVAAWGEVELKAAAAPAPARGQLELL